MMLGWMCLIGAVICFLVSMNPPVPQASYSYSGADPYTIRELQRATTAWLWGVGAATLFSLFLVFWSVGYVVRAISFLPGKDPGSAGSS
jgi:hypothetical protein